MKKIIFPILMILFVVGGAVAADMVRNGGGDASATTSDHKPKKSKKKDSHAKDKGHGKKDDGHKKPDKKKKDDGHGKKDKKKKDSHGKSDGHGDASSADTINYLKFKRQFVVPVMHEGTIEALVIMNINLELGDDAPDYAYSFEPKLRDAITRELLGLSNDGIFGAQLTTANAYETIRQRLLEACQAVLTEGISDILILDVARQEQ